jgi:dihydrofolate synthase/folylpolyglutamate synthase
VASPHPARTALFSLEQIGIKLGLDQIRALIAALGHPDRAFPSVVVAGTNGKGSVAAMLERGLRAAGFRTGRFTSPHLVHLEERFAVQGTAIDDATLDVLAARVLDAARALPAPPSFFEATTAIALEAFRDARVDVAVLEVGLGGRLDATNAVDAAVSVITMIDFDHQQYLGDTLDAIAREKAGVIKPGAVVVLADNPPVVEREVADAAAARGATLVRAWVDATCGVRMHDGHAVVSISTPRRTYADLRLALAGRHQAQNALTAVRAFEEIDGRFGRPIDAAAIATALTDAAWPARLESRHAGGIDLMIDGAHNPAGARALAAHLRETYGRPLPIVVGVMRDKDVDAILGTLAAEASVLVCTAPRSPRAATAVDLAAAARRIAPGLAVAAIDDPSDAIRLAAGHGGPVVVAGSLYLAGQVRDEFS